MMNGRPTTIAAELLDELDRRLRGAAGREHVVVDEHALARRDRVGVHLERVEAVLERVLDADRPPGQLAGLPRRRRSRSRAGRRARRR